MSYRKITVDGKEYIYQTGEKITKVRHGRHAKSTFFSNDEFGELIAVYDQCSCGPDYNCLGGEIVGYERVITPKSVAAMIRSRPVA